MTNVVIIGGGHNGLSAAFYLAKAGLKPIVRRERAFRRLAQRWLDAAALSGQ